MVSSTYFHILQFPVVDRSSIIITKSQGPSFVPCGTPDGMEPHSEKQSWLSFTLCLLHDKKSVIQVMMELGRLSVASKKTLPGEGDHVEALVGTADFVLPI